MTAAAPASLLVTGAGGFVGGHLVAALRARMPGITVIATSRAPGPGLTALDVTDASAVTKLVADLQPAACFHLAALAAVSQSYDDPRRVWEINLHGTLNLAEALLRSGGRLIFASSAEVYGLSFKTREVIDEAAPLQPANPYAVAKAAADLALGEMALRGLDVVRFRLFNHTGIGQAERYVVPAFARQVARIEAGLQEPVITTGALDRWRDFLDVSDVVEAYVSAFRTSALPPGVAVNISSGTPRRIGDILTDFLDLAGVQARIIEQPPASRPNDLRLSAGSPRLAQELLDWAPRIPWSRTTIELLDHWRGRVAAEGA